MACPPPVPFGLSSRKCVLGERGGGCSSSGQVGDKMEPWGKQGAGEHGAEGALVHVALFFLPTGAGAACGVLVVRCLSRGEARRKEGRGRAREVGCHHWAPSDKGSDSQLEDVGTSTPIIPQPVWLPGGFWELKARQQSSAPPPRLPGRGILGVGRPDIFQVAKVEKRRDME